MPFNSTPFFCGDVKEWTKGKIRAAGVKVVKNAFPQKNQCLQGAPTALAGLKSFRKSCPNLARVEGQGGLAAAFAAFQRGFWGFMTPVQNPALGEMKILRLHH